MADGGDAGATSGPKKDTGRPAAIRLHVLRGAAGQTDLVEWGSIPPLDREQAQISKTRGILLYRGAEKYPEAGLWECSPGNWACRVDRDEFCHFLAGRCVYTHESGDRTEICGGDAAFFPAGWNGTCEVIETVRKVYLIH